MNLIIIPFHDWRKILKEGFRTRDAHFIESLQKSDTVEKLIVINRPTTIVEILIKKKEKKIQGKVIHRFKGFQCIEVDANTYVIDYISNDIFGQMRRKFLWFMNQFASDDYVKFINECLVKLNVENYNSLSQNIFAQKLTEKLSPNKSAFDAWDNFSLIDDYTSIKNKIDQAYAKYVQSVDFWITNSSDNFNFFSREFTSLQIKLIKNGLDLNRFNLEKEYSVPRDLENIKRPIVGFGGKITQTINTELINYAVKNNPDISFVFIGQILDNQIFESIHKANNMYYLGDKFYDEYPNYVNSFDICLVPYHVEENKKSGTNPIKVYEYLALNKKVIGTNGNGLEDLEEHLYLINTKEELSNEIKRGTTNEKINIDLKDNNWGTKTNEFLSLLA